jgi:hypothetical protein
VNIKKNDDGDEEVIISKQQFCLEASKPVNNGQPVLKRKKGEHLFFIPLANFRNTMMVGIGISFGCKTIFQFIFF